MTDGTDRREFLKNALALVAATGFVPLGDWGRVIGAGTALAASAPSPLAVARNGSAEAMTRAAIDTLGGMKSFVSRITSYNVCYTKLLRWKENGFEYQRN